MILLQALISYEAYKWQIWLVIGLFFAMVAIAVFYLVKSKLLDNYTEIDCTDCEHEPVNYKVGATFYGTEEGARTRCEGLYKRHGVNAEVTLYFANEKPIKVNALDIWDFNK